MAEQSFERFHLGFPISDIEETRKFYGEILGCDIVRSSERTININFWGHQLVGHLIPEFAGKHGTNEIDGNPVPVHHFGVILEWDEWEALAERIRASEHDFVFEPYVRDKGLPEEEGKMFFRDPSGNTMEFKTFKNEDQIFAG
ncbi:VOC family protein [Halalkalibaculum sp. DA384]|uniref:VOC family protein n=1 Tax=Halalkalibaculum sp. DA384 TaxID=3373606 RepID=UPI003753EF29